jgi:hypothetical protein
MLPIVGGTKMLTIQKITAITKLMVSRGNLRRISLLTGFMFICFLFEVI